jgi:hypothetical protein
VADVRLRLHGETADVEPDLARLERHEVTDLAGLGVVEPHRRKSREPEATYRLAADSRYRWDSCDLR